MKKAVIGFLGSVLLTLIACSGSDAYKGDWKATDAIGSKFQLHFDPKVLSITDSLGTVLKYEYTQHSVKIENSIATYGIQLSDGRGYQLQFPVSGNKNVALFKDESGQTVYSLGRDEYIGNDELYKLH